MPGSISKNEWSEEGLSYARLTPEAAPKVQDCYKKSNRLLFSGIVATIVAVGGLLAILHGAHVLGNVADKNWVIAGSIVTGVAIIAAAILFKQYSNEKERADEKHANRSWIAQESAKPKLGVPQSQRSHSAPTHEGLLEQEMRAEKAKQQQQMRRTH